MGNYVVLINWLIIVIILMLGSRREELYIPWRPWSGMLFLGSINPLKGVWGFCIWKDATNSPCILLLNEESRQLKRNAASFIRYNIILIWIKQVASYVLHYILYSWRLIKFSFILLAGCSCWMKTAWRGKQLVSR